MAIQFEVAELSVLSFDWFSARGNSPDKLMCILSELDEDGSNKILYIPLFTLPEARKGLALVKQELPEGGATLKVKKGVNDEGYEEYRLIVSAASKGEAAIARMEAAQSAVATD